MTKLLLDPAFFNYAILVLWGERDSLARCSVNRRCLLLGVRDGNHGNRHVSLQALRGMWSPHLASSQDRPRHKRGL